jgi:hypothetical protein
MSETACWRPPQREWGHQSFPSNLSIFSRDPFFADRNAHRV